MAQFVDPEPGLGAPATADPRALWPFLIQLVTRLTTLLAVYASRINLCLPHDGSEAMTGPLQLAAYTTATRPSAASYPYALIYVTDAAAGQHVQVSNGSTWSAVGG